MSDINGVDDNDLYDVCVKVASYGLHSPWNHHSFQNVSFFRPRKCEMGCDELVIFGQGACLCLRCNVLCHRRCIRNHVICLQTLSSPSPSPSLSSSFPSAGTSYYLQSLFQSVPSPVYDIVYSLTRSSGANSLNEDPSPIGASFQNTQRSLPKPLIPIPPGAPIKQQTLLLNRSPLLQPPPPPPPPPTRFSLPSRSSSSHSSPSTTEAMTSSSSSLSSSSSSSLSCTLMEVPALSKLPFPFSPGCIWSGSLKAIAARSNMTNVSMPTQATTDEDNADERERAFVYKILSDGNSFCGQVCVCLRALYLDIIFESTQESLDHAQGCLRCVLHAVLHIYPSHLRLLNVVRSVEQQVLDSAHGMYEKVFTAAVLASHEQDMSLSIKITKSNLGKKSLALHQAEDDSELNLQSTSQTCNSLFDAFLSAQSPMEKLGHITECLRILSSSQPQVTNTSPSSSSSPSSSLTPEGDSPEPVDTDTLVNRLREEIIIYTMSNPQMTSSGITRSQWSSFPSISILSLWYATITFINALIHEEVMLGAEGYSLVTLHQALEVI